MDCGLIHLISDRKPPSSRMPAHLRQVQTLLDSLSVMQFVLTLLRNRAVIEECTEHKGARRGAR